MHKTNTKKENIYTIPNLLCISRIIMAPFISLMIMLEHFEEAFGMLIFAGFTDFLDGWIARRWSSQSSKLGSFLDPFADKILIAALFLSLTFLNLIPIPLTCLIIFRDVILMIAGLVIRYRSLNPPRTLCKYFNASFVTVQLFPTIISKVNTFIQLLLGVSTLIALISNYVNNATLQALWFLTGASTVAAGLSYLLAENTYKIVRK